MIEQSVHKSWRDYSDATLPPILDAARACFVEHGYDGTTTRMLAASAGLSVPGLYYHYPHKHDVLVEVMTFAMEDLWKRSMAALAEAGGDVLRQLDLLVECLVLYHAHRRDLAFLAASEIRSLQEDAKTTHIGRRDRQQRLMDTTVEYGAAQGIFVAEDPRSVSRALVTMCTGVSQWYRHDRTLGPDEVASRYQTIARRALCCDPSCGQ